MKTKIQKDGNQVRVQLSGYLDFETAGPFRENLDTLLKETKATTVVFDFADLNFVGSCGITAFVQALKEFNGRALHKPLYVNVRSEFRRIIDAFGGTNSFHFAESEAAFQSDDQSLTELDN